MNWIFFQMCPRTPEKFSEISEITTGSTGQNDQRSVQISVFR
jgi:hypothetical protein